MRRHEEAHARVGGEYAGQPSYEFQQGPDGKNYAVSGEVPIDVSPVADDPEATIEKMRIVKAAALAPAEPSGQDRKVAATADQESAKAQAELMARRREEAAGGPPADEPRRGFAAYGANAGGGRQDPILGALFSISA